MFLGLLFRFVLDEVHDLAPMGLEERSAERDGTGGVGVAHSLAGGARLFVAVCQPLERPASAVLEHRPAIRTLSRLGRFLLDTIRVVILFLD